MASLVPEQLVSFYETWRTRNPVTLNEKIRHKMVHDKRPLLTLFADKFRVRDFIAERVGSSLLPTLFDSTTDAKLIDWKSLPREFVAKVNHGSGGVIVVSLAADPATRLPSNLSRLDWNRYLIHPDTVDFDSLSAILNRWLSMSFGQQKLRGIREWAYKDIQPRVLVEEFVGSKTTLPPQIATTCIHGRPEEILYYPGSTSFNRDFPVRFLRDDFRSVAATTGLPESLIQELLTLSEKVARSIDFVRVDWLITENGLVFGELTNYPAGGRLLLGGNRLHSPRELDVILGNLWTVPPVEGDRLWMRLGRPDAPHARPERGQPFGGF
jgi:hypothetical protein